MLPQHILFALVATVAAVPLNINLGAYSPALVVGDGEISLGSTESASELMATLQTGADENKPGQTTKTQVAPTPAEPKADDEKDQNTEGDAAKRAPNLRRALDELIGKRSPAEEKMVAVEAAMNWIKRDLASFNAALGYAKEAMKDTPKIEIGSDNAGVGIVVNPGENIQKGSAAAGNLSKRSEVIPEDEAPKMTVVAIAEI